MKGEASNSDIVVAIAALNEEKGIGPTIEEIRFVLNNAYFLVVDGRSVDKTVEIAKNLGADVVFQKKKGKGEAISQSIKKLDNAKYVVFIDADFTYPAEYIPHMIEILEDMPEVGMVVGNRFNNKFSFRNAMNNMFYLGNRLLAFAQHVVNGIKLDDPLSGLRVVKGTVLKGWKPRSKGFDIEAELNYYIERKGYRIVEIPIHYRRRWGEKKLKLRHGFSILNRIIAESLI